MDKIISIYQNYCLRLVPPLGRAYRIYMLEPHFPRLSIPYLFNEICGWAGLNTGFPWEMVSWDMDVFPPGNQILFSVAIVFLSPQNAIETIKSLFFKPAHLRKVSCTCNELLKYVLLEFQSWSRCPRTCVGQGVALNSNLPGATLILCLNLLIHPHLS